MWFDDLTTVGQTVEEDRNSVLFPNRSSYLFSVFLFSCQDLARSSRCENHTIFSEAKRSWDVHDEKSRTSPSLFLVLLMWARVGGGASREVAWDPCAICKVSLETQRHLSRSVDRSVTDRSLTDPSRFLAWHADLHKIPVPHVSWIMEHTDEESFDPFDLSFRLMGDGQRRDLLYYIQVGSF